MAGLPRLAALLTLTLTASATTTHKSPSYSNGPILEGPVCRFAPLFTQDIILNNPEPFISTLLYWEGHFAQPGIGYNGANGMTYDGTLPNIITGLAWANASGRHNFSAASKESLYVMVLSQALAGDASAARVVSPKNPGRAPWVAYSIMKQKLAN